MLAGDLRCLAYMDERESPETIEFITGAKLLQPAGKSDFLSFSMVGTFHLPPLTDIIAVWIRCIEPCN